MKRGTAITGRSGNRCGAIVVMAGIFIIALMLVAAISVDASRIFAAKNELQTAADAAALAGAIQLLEDSSFAVDSSRAYAARNRVEQDSISSVEIVPGVWHPADASFEAVGPPWNAVRVTTRHALPLSLARILGDSTVTITSSAIAWSSAPIAETGCSKPLAVPYGRLLHALGYPSWTNMNLTDDDINRLRETPIAERIRVELPYASNPEDTTWYNSPNDDEYFPIDIDSTWSPKDPLTNLRDSVPSNSFRSYMVGPPSGRCSRMVAPGDQIRSEPGNKIGAVHDGLDSLCQREGGSFDGNRCYRDGAAVGIPLKVVFWEDDGLSWHNSNRAVLRARLTGAFVLEEFWPVTETDPETRGALFGYFDVVRDFGVVDETSPSTLVRPVLVR
jgi:hypothetical protein